MVSPRSQQARISSGDLLAGISVALVLIPQALAYADLAGMPSHYGLFAAALPPIVAAFFASSPYLQTGPVAMTSVLTLGALTVIATPSTPHYIADAALLALIVGVVRISLGVARAGFVAFLMSQPVLMGFTTAAALLICAAQIPAVVGLSPPADNIVGRLLWTLSHPQQWRWPELVMTAATLALIIGGRYLHALFPGVLVAVVGGVIYSTLAHYDGLIIEDFPTTLPQLTIDLPWSDLRHLLIPGIVIALVGFAEPAAIARTLATQTRQSWSANRELISQGVANIAAGICGAFPVGGSFSRTMINRAAGGTSRWSGLVTGAVVLAFLPFAAVLAPLPRAILAAIVISAVIKLIRFTELLALWHMSRAQAIVAWATFALTIILAPRVDLAVLLGIGIGIAVHLWRERRAQINVTYHDRTLTLEPVGVLYFGSAPTFDEALLNELAQHPTADALVIDLRKVGRIDYTGALVIKRLAADADAAGLSVTILAGQPPQGPRLMRRVLGPQSPWLR